MIDKNSSFLAQHFARLQKVEETTIRGLGKECTHLFIDIWNDWFEILSAINHTYSKEELVNSVVYFYLQALSKECGWLQLLFLSGNYPLLGRCLRFIWEMIYRAHYVDMFEGEKQPGPSVDLRMAWLSQREEANQLNWNHCIKPALFRVFPLAEREKEVEQFYHRLWQQLNKYAHPSTTLFSRIIDNGLLLVTDGFDETWAREALDVATEIFDLVWLAVINRFQSCAKHLAQKGLLVEYRVTQLVLKELK